MSGAGAHLEPFAAEWFRLLGAVAIEAAIVGLLLVLLVRVGRRLPSSVRYAIVLVAVAKFLLPPVTAPWSLSIAAPDFGIGAALIDASPPATLPSEALVSSPAQPSTRRPATTSPQPAAAQRVTTQSSRGVNVAQIELEDARSAAESMERIVPGQVGSSLSTGGALLTPASVSGRVLMGLLIVQLVGAIWLLQRRARQHVSLARYTRRCHRVEDPALLTALRAACREQGLRRVPELLASPDGFGPAAAGLWRRRIFLPTIVLGCMPVSHLQPVLAHEVAHHRRGGLWIDTALFLGSLVWWPHPVYWLVGRELRRCREECCDAAALSCASSAGAYCQRLLDVAAILGRRQAPIAVAPGSLSHPLGRRIRNIMNGNVQKPRFPIAWVLLIFLLTVVATPTFTAYGSWVVKTGLLSQNISFSVDDGVIDLSRGAIDALVERGLDRDFVEQLDGSENLDLSINDLRQWIASGFDAELADELEAFGIDSLTTMEALRLVWVEVTADYVSSLRQIGFTGIDAGEIGRLARYEVTARYISGFQAQGYDELDVDDLVRLSRYDVEPEYAAGFVAAGYDLSVDDLVRLHRYGVEPEYAGAFRDGGYDLSVDDVVRLHRYDVEPEYAGTYRAAGYEPSVDELVRLNRYGVDDDAVAELSAAGLRDFSVDDLVHLQRYGVEEDYIRAVTEDGTYSVSVENLVQLNRYDVTPEYLQQLRASGRDLSVDEVVRLKRYEVDPGLVQQLEQAGYGDSSTDDLVRLQRYGVDAATIRAMSAAATRQLGVDELVTLKRYDVDAAYVAGLAALGFGHLDADDVVRLKRYDVEPSFIERLQNAGFEDLTIDQIIRLKRASG